TVAGGFATSPYLWFAAGLALGLAGDAALVPGRLIRRTRGGMLAPVPAEEPAIAPPPRAVPAGLGPALGDVAPFERPPFAVPVDTRRLADGLYDFRALGADRGGLVELSRTA